jgi:hypothetical protein
VNLLELKQKLVEAGVPEGNYFLVGIDVRGYPTGAKGAGNGELMVEFDEEEGWVLRKYERGIRTWDEPFPTEDAVCQVAWEELKPRHRPPILELTPEELARGRELNEQHKRDYERATEEFRRQRHHAQDPGSS